jgi:phosphatidylinositol glycan class U
VFTNCAILYAISKAVSGKPMSSILALGLASYLSLYPILLLPPLILLCYDRQARSKKETLYISTYSVRYISMFLGTNGWFLYLSNILTAGSWEFLSSTYGVQLLLPDLTPNMGLWWYFFIEMFDSFREFFLGVFWLHLGGYVGGLCIRVRKQPLFVITTLLGIFAIFKPYPSLSDTSLYFAMLPFYRHIFPRK